MILGKEIFVLCLCLVACNICFGQADSIEKKLAIRTMYILKFDDKPSLVTEYAYVDPMFIKHIGSLSDPSLKELKATLKVDDILVFSLERQVNLLTFQDVLKLYKIQRLKRKWILKVDDTFIEYPGTMVISKNQIKKVISRNNYIHIILKDYYELKEKYKKAKVIHN